MVRLSWMERERIANTVIENYGGGARINEDMDDGVFDVSAVKALIREAIWIAGIEEENAPRHMYPQHGYEPDIVPGSEEDLIRREADPDARWTAGGPTPTYSEEAQEAARQLRTRINQDLDAGRFKPAEPQHGQTGYATGNGFGHG